MKTLRVLSALGALSVLTMLGYGQATNAPGQSKKGDDQPKGGRGDITEERQTVEDAKALGRAGKVADVESAVATLNIAPANTAEWHLETAQRVVQTAEELAREGRAGQVEPLIRRALQQLTQAEAKAKDAATKAAAKTLTGFLQERYLADDEAAETAYEAAAQLAPNEAKSAKEAAERLKQNKGVRQGKEKDREKEKEKGKG